MRLDTFGVARAQGDPTLPCATLSLISLALWFYRIGLGIWYGDCVVVGLGKEAAGSSATGLVLIEGLLERLCADEKEQ
ncbi:MAG: hypothetical protein WB611_21510, partial [Stellaceae bacterium]